MFLGLNSLLTAGAALGVVLALIWLGARAARLTGLAPRPAGTRVLALQDSLALDSRRRLLVVRCGARDVVLMTGGAQDVVVGWLPQPLPAAVDRRSDGAPPSGAGGPQPRAGSASAVVGQRSGGEPAPPVGEQRPDGGHDA